MENGARARGRRGKSPGMKCMDWFGPGAAAAAAACLPAWHRQPVMDYRASVRIMRGGAAL